MTTKISYIDLLRSKIEERADIKAILESSAPLDELFRLDLPMKESRKLAYINLYRGVGNTRIHPSQDSETNSWINIKMEHQNISGSNHYSRYWIIYLFLCEALFVFDPQKVHLIETSSGSSGIALAIACSKLGINLTLVIPEELPHSRVKPMLPNGGYVKVIREGGYLSGCITRMRQLIGTGKYFCPDHSRETSNLLVAVFRRIFWEYIDTNGYPDYAILALGNGSSVRAATEVFDIQGKTKIITFEPDYDAFPQHYTFGLAPPNVEMPHVDFLHGIGFQRGKKIKTSYLAKVKALYSEDSIISFLGESSLYALHFATEIASNNPNSSIMTIGYDLIDRYGD